MSTKEILELILDKLPFTKYRLSKRLDIPYTSLLRYLSGKNEASFLDVYKWLDNLHLKINGDKIYFKSFLNDELATVDKATCRAVFNSFEDSTIWKLEEEKYENKEGHQVVWLDRQW